MTIYVARHGETEWNVAGRRQGRADSPLTSKGIRQAQLAGELLSKLVGDLSRLAFYSSSLGRARRTSGIMCQELGYPLSKVRYTDLLAECEVGVWTGLTNEEIRAQCPGQLEEREEDKWGYVIPEGESYAMLSGRAEKWLAELEECAVALAVTHEMMSRAIQGRYLRLSTSETLDRSHPQNCVYKLSGGRIETLLTG